MSLPLLLLSFSSLMSPSPSHPCRYGRSRAAASRITDHLNRSSIAPRIRAFLVPRSSLPYAAGNLPLSSLFFRYKFIGRAPTYRSPPSSCLTCSLFHPTFPAPLRALTHLHLYRSPSHTISLSISICFLPVTATPTPQHVFTYVIPRARARATGPANARTSYTLLRMSDSLRIQFYAFNVYSTAVIGLRKGCLVV